MKPPAILFALAGFVCSHAHAAAERKPNIARIIALAACFFTSARAEPPPRR